MAETTALAAPVLPAPASPPVNKWLVTVSITFGTLMGAIDSSIVNVAIDHIRGSVGATIEEITWVSTGFIIANVMVMPLTAFLGRLLGQKRVYMFCLGLFLVGSALCGTAGSLGTLVLWRFIQGLGAGALQPTESAILRQTFPPEEQGMATAVFGLAVMIGPAVGPTLGGYIVDNHPWPWIFYINIPVGLLGLFMVSRFVHEPEDIRIANHIAAEKQRKNLDWPGISLMCVGIAALQYVLEEGQRDDWFESNTIVVLSVVAFFALSAFVIQELSAPAPAVNLRLFKDKVFLAGAGIGSVMFAMLMANMFLLPIFLQELLGFTAMQSGIALVPRVVVMMLAVPIVGRLYNHIQPRLIVGFGILAFFVGAVLMSRFDLDTSASGVYLAVAIQGIGFACLFVPLTTVAFTNIPRDKMMDATGMNSLLRQVGGSIGLALFATELSRYTVAAKASVAAHITATRPEVAGMLAMFKHGMVQQGFDSVTAGVMSLGMMAGDVARQASMLAFEKIFLLAGLLFLLVLPLLVFLKVENWSTGGRAHVEME